MYKQIPKDIRMLLVKYSLQKISSEELLKLHEWKHQNDINAAIFERYSNQKYVQSSVAVLGHINPDEDWQKVKQRTLKYNWRYTVMKYVAVLVVMLCIGSVLFYLNSPSVVDSVNVEHIEPTIKPGSSKAILVLSDGKELELGQMALCEIHTGNNSRVIQSQQQITYTKPESADLLAEGSIEWHTLKIPRGGEYKLMLDDGTEVWLNAESELKYPVNFMAQQRVVHLTGEAYFKVAHDVDKPFIVSSEFQRIRVYGTEFNVNTYDAKAMTTVLVEGAVGLQYGDNKETKLRPGECAVLQAYTDAVNIKSVDTYLYTSWKDGEFVFNNETLKSITNKLSRWYDVEFTFSNNAINSYRFTCHLKRYDNLEDLLFFFENTSNIRFVRKGKTIRVSNK